MPGRAPNASWLVAFVIGLCSCAHSDSSPAPPLAASPSPRAGADPITAALATDLDGYISAFGRTWGEGSAFHGYVAVARDGHILFGKAYGKADRERGTAATSDTLFRLASLTKPFTAIGIMQLAEKGRLRIEDPIRKYLPELPPMADPVTIEHCLTHTSGVPPLPDDPALVAETGAVHPVATAFASYKDKALRFRPGDHFEYSNAGYTILGAIIERVSGQSYEAYMREHVFGPAGMTRTTTISKPLPPDTALGYAVGDDGVIQPARPITYVTFGCGAILSDADDLVAFDRALSGTVLLDEASKRRMYTPRVDVGALVGMPAKYGLGWFVAQDGGHDLFFHAGGVDGFDVTFARVPDAGLSIVVLSNVVGVRDVVTRIATAAREIALTGKGPAPIEEPAIASFDQAEVSRLEGDYRLDDSSADTVQRELPLDGSRERFGWASLSARHDQLVATFAGGGGAVIFRAADGRLFTKHDWSVAAEGEQDGRARTLTVSSLTIPLQMRFTRLSARFDEATPRECPSGMAPIPGGSFDMADGRRVTTQPFCLDLGDVTVGAYEACVRSGRCRPAPTTVQFEGMTDALRAKWTPRCNGARKDRLDHPANCVDWSLSAAYCHVQGKRLPTDEEWEWAARGGAEDRLYPWGYREPGAQLCWSGVQPLDSSCPVGAFPAGDGRGGTHDLAGNVGQWTSTAAPGGYVARGSGWNMGSAEAARVETREVLIPTFRGPSTGFRCAK